MPSSGAVQRQGACLPSEYEMPEINSCLFGRPGGRQRGGKKNAWRSIEASPFSAEPKPFQTPRRAHASWSLRQHPAP